MHLQSFFELVLPVLLVINRASQPELKILVQLLQVDLPRQSFTGPSNVVGFPTTLWALGGVPSDGVISYLQNKNTKSTIDA